MIKTTTAGHSATSRATSEMCAKTNLHDTDRMKWSAILLSLYVSLGVRRRFIQGGVAEHPEVIIIIHCWFLEKVQACYFFVLESAPCVNRKTSFIMLTDEVWPFGTPE
jgi:hypothetical protein